MNATTEMTEATDLAASGPSGAITVTGPAPMIIDPANAKKRPILNAEEARMLTVEIQKTSMRLWLLVAEAHDRSAHFALGYASWDDYVRGELKMSPSRSYQLLDTGHVMRELAAAGVNIETLNPPPARVVARIKDRLPEVRRVARKALKDGEHFDEALRDLAKQPQTVKGEVVKQRSAADVNKADEKTVTEKVDGRKTAKITCPACEGDGKVSRSLGNRLRAFLKAS